MLPISRNLQSPAVVNQAASGSLVLESNPTPIQLESRRHDGSGDGNLDPITFSFGADDLLFEDGSDDDDDDDEKQGTEEFQDTGGLKRKAPTTSIITTLKGLNNQTTKDIWSALSSPWLNLSSPGLSSPLLNLGPGLSSPSLNLSTPWLTGIGKGLVQQEKVGIENEGDASQKHLMLDKAAASVIIPTPNVLERAASSRSSPNLDFLFWDKDFGDRHIGFDDDMIPKKPPLELEMDHLLTTVMCQTFSLPLVHYWVPEHPIVGPLRVMCQKANAAFENLLPRKFKETCLLMRLNVGEGLVGKTYATQKSFFCRDITELGTTNHPLALAPYSLYCGSIACYTIYFCSSSLKYKSFVLEVFLPSQEIDTYYPRILLNSLLAKLEEHLPYNVLASGKPRGQVLSVEVINTSTHNEPESFVIGQPKSSPPYHKVSEIEEGVLDIERSNSTINSDEATTTGEMSKRGPDNVAEIIYLDELEEVESPTQCIKPQGLTFQLKRIREMIEGERNTAWIDHCALGMNSKDSTKYKSRSVTNERADEFEEESPIKCTEPQSLISESKRSRKILEDEGNTVEIDHSASEMLLKEAIQHGGDTVADQREGHTSKREKASGKDVSHESLSQLFGRPLDDARKIFGASRTAFKTMCRDVGIERWKYGKRNMGRNFSKPRRRLNDEAPGRRNFSAGMPPVQDTPVVADTSHESNKMTVKATYNGVSIRFNLPDLSGISYIKDNVIKRLPLERNSFSIKYQDDEGEWVLIACDEDVRECMEFSRSLKKTTIKMLLDPPVDQPKDR